MGYCSKANGGHEICLAPATFVNRPNLLTPDRMDDIMKGEEAEDTEIEKKTWKETIMQIISNANLQIAVAVGGGLPFHEMPSIIKILIEKIKQNPTHAEILVGVGIGGAAVLFAPAIISAAGFCTTGVLAGSPAAAAQAAIGNGAAGSLFASLQSAGVLGLALNTKVLIFVGVAGAVIAGENFVASINNTDCDENGETKWEEIAHVKFENGSTTRILKYVDSWLKSKL